MLQENQPKIVALSGHDHDHDAAEHSHVTLEHAPGAAVHGHNHAAPARLNDRSALILRVSLVLTGLFVIAEFAAGLWANSLALISDAGHNLTDALALAFSWWALVLARRSPDTRKTYGYHRAGILAASFNAATLVLIAFYIFYEGVQRLIHPEPVNGAIIALVATVALLLKTGIALALFKGSKTDRNMRGAFVHILGDAFSSIGVIFAGLLILFTGWAAFDPAISILIGVFILWSSWRIIREATNVLLEGIPAGLDMVSLMRDFMVIDGVKSVHDLHVWTLGGNNLVLSCHILTNNISIQEANTTVQQIKNMLVHKYQVHHTTIELECENCTLPEDLYCTIVTSTN
ncbi:MAG: hypothetical protein JWP00_1748 [Chloroflexi bacterium]|jgi:cobalt-zinc-cadmium efflux system protein|nr:hypothetical protein [Chloroflexota bacterium]